MSVNPQEARCPPVNQPEKGFMPTYPQVPDAHFCRCMANFDPLSATFPPTLWNMCGCNQNPLLSEFFIGNSAHCFATDSSNMTRLQGINEEEGTTVLQTGWTDEMVKLLITAVSYTGEDSQSPNILVFPREDMWWAISCAMNDRGYLVSPQQCEDKFNDLNNKYWRLIEILGIRAACNVHENPSLIDFMDLPDEIVAEVQSILGCEQLFYREMYSLHNGNRKFLPEDPALQKSLHSALKCNCGCQEVTHKSSSKRKRENGEGESSSNGSALTWVQLQEMKYKLKEEKLKLEKRKLKWLRTWQQMDLELEAMRLENKFMKLENKRLAAEIERKRGCK